MLEHYLTPYTANKRIVAQQGVLVLAPHPDDEIFGCGGALAQHVADQTPLQVVILSDGQAQGIADMRRAESCAAAQVIGYGTPVFWGLSDRHIHYSEALVNKVIDVLWDNHLDLVYCPSPMELHPDHRQTALIAIEAIKRLGGNYRVAFYEISAPLHPNVLLDISAQAAIKTAAAQCFKSQLAVHNYGEHIAALNRYRTYTLGPDVLAAEAYLVQNAQDLDEPHFASFAKPRTEQTAPALVSVLIRSMNRPLLAQALASIALQNYPHIEVLIISATPNHDPVPSHCGPHPVRFIRTDEVLNRCAAANRGLETAQGRYLIFLDDDDWFLPDHISRLARTLSQGALLYRAAYCGVALVDYDNRPTGDIFDNPFDSVQLKARNITPIHAVLFDRSLVSAGCHFDQSLAQYEDWDFWLQISQHTLMAHLPGASAIYRIHDSSGVHEPSAKSALQILHEKWGALLNDAELTVILERVFQYGELLKTNVELRTKVEYQQRNNAQLETQKDQLLFANLRLSHQRDGLLNSTSWRITAPLRHLSKRLGQIRRYAPVFLSILQHPDQLAHLTGRAIVIFRSSGLAGLRDAIKGRKTLPQPKTQENYQVWIADNEPAPSHYSQLAIQVDHWQTRSLISIVMPTYNTPIEVLEQAIDSVIGQIYPHWELCIADDCSTDPLVQATIAAKAQSDSRIKWLTRSSNGHICAASNSALSLAHGEFIALLDHDDLLHPLALWYLAKAINAHPQVGLLYSDEDKLGPDRQRREPYFKCIFNRELMLAQNMISHLGCYRKSIVEKVGGFRIGFEGSQDYDLALRVIETLKPDQIVHVPHVLYHWRMLAGSSAVHINEKSYAPAAALRAVQEHLDRQGITAHVTPNPEAPQFQRVCFECPSPIPKVSIIIPTRDKAELLEKCVFSIFSKTSYPNYEIIIVDNGSEEERTAQLFKRLRDMGVNIVEDRRPFNYSALNNHAAKIAQGSFLCLMNNDIEILTPDWLEDMVSFANQKEIGAVGARLWYPHGVLQHAGVLIGPGGVAGHAFLGLPKDNPGYFHRAVLHQSYSAVTAACLVIRKSIFDELGGLDESLAVAFNDVDFCLRVLSAGYRNVWTPYAQMVHHESASRGQEDTLAKRLRFEQEKGLFRKRWGHLLGCDPAYSLHLSLDTLGFEFAAQSRAPQF